MKILLVQIPLGLIYRTISEVVAGSYGIKTEYSLFSSLFPRTRCTGRRPLVRLQSNSLGQDSMEVDCSCSISSIIGITSSVSLVLHLYRPYGGWTIPVIWVACTWHPILPSRYDQLSFFLQTKKTTTFFCSNFGFNLDYSVLLLGDYWRFSKLLNI